ncbi:MAG TPA: protein kinase [Polyangiaceae bacterium]|nr:protein kinase [Polyangiaceae bacterium]
MSAHLSARTIGRYSIFGEIASGGMATVHYGRLVGPVGFSRTVAIKRLHAQYAKDPEFVAMFLDEARLAARIQHPNVVPTLDVVSTDGELFLVMEYVQGETLARLNRVVRDAGSHMPSRIALTIIVQVLHGLHAAHEAKDERGAPLGIVHRDISPQNVLVGVDGVARVLDFGVAKAAVRLQTTREGQLKGKLAYMAPEQIGGQVDRLTDIYAAGVLLWESLTGKRLYEAVNEGQLLQKVLRGKFDRPSVNVPGLSAVLDEITVRALELDPRKRFATAREMALALERTGELAMSSEVGDWVENTARPELSRKAERLAEIESSTKTRIPVARAHAPPDDSTERMANPPSGSSGASGGHTPGTAPAESTPGGGHQASASSKRDPSRRRILVIDDSEVMLGRIRAALEAEGYDVVTTTRAVGNARHIATCDLVIIDYHMPGIDGGTVIQSLRSARSSGGGASEHPCLFYLYTSDAQIAGIYQKLGFDGVLTDKGDEASLVKQVKAVFRIVAMRSMRKRT